MHGSKSPEEDGSVSLRSCSEDTPIFTTAMRSAYIALDDLRDLGVAMQSVGDEIERPTVKNFTSFNKKGLVQ